MAEVKLLGFWNSPFSHRVEWALKFKGVKYEYVEEDKQNKSPLLLQSNPIHKKIPVLIHNGKAIVESMIIVEYIDETFEGPPILPKDPYDRAIARFWAKFIDDKAKFFDDKLWSDHVCPTTALCGRNIHSLPWLVSGLSTFTVLSAFIKTFLRQGEEQEKGKEEACEMLKVLDNELKDKKFFVGDKFGFADIAANFVGIWLKVYEEAGGVDFVTSEKFPNFCAWKDEYINCSQVKEYLPPMDKLVALVKANIQAASSASAPK